MYNLTSCHLPTKFGVSYCFQFTANFDFLQTNIKLRSQILPGSISNLATFALNFALHSTSISLHVISISIPASSFGFNSFYLIHSPTPSISSQTPPTIRPNIINEKSIPTKNYQKLQRNFRFTKTIKGDEQNSQSTHRQNTSAGSEKIKAF